MTKVSSILSLSLHCYKQIHVWVEVCDYSSTYYLHTRMLIVPANMRVELSAAVRLLIASRQVDYSLRDSIKLNVLPQFPITRG